MLSNIAFRVDASSDMGTGHLMRCITLADELKGSSANIIFVARHMPNYLQDLIAAKGYLFKLLISEVDDSIDELNHAVWLGTSQSIDAFATIKALEATRIDWIIIDHYALDFRWETKLRPYVNKIIVIDDLADRHHDCDVLFDQNYHQNANQRYEGKVPKGCQQLLGPHYALLRADFSQFRKISLNKSVDVKRVLVFFGGVDAENYTTFAITALTQINQKNLFVDVVIGNRHPQKNAILELCMSNQYNCHVQIDYMAELMSQADISIGAGGGAVWERCCMGLPTIAIATALNQKLQLNSLAQDGYCYTFNPSNNIVESLKLHILALIENENLRLLLAEKSATLVDGLGAARVKNFIIQGSTIHIRHALPSDEKNIFEWRNHPSIRAVSIKKDSIDFVSHQTWFKNTLQNTSIKLLIAEVNSNPVGVIRFDLMSQVAEISIYLIQQKNEAQQKNGSGLGYAILTAAEAWLLKQYPLLKEFSANVLDGNIASHKLFKKAGYQIESSNYKKIVN